MKLVRHYLGIQCPRFEEVTDWAEAAEVVSRLRFPMIVKHSEQLRAHRVDIGVAGEDSRGVGHPDRDLQRSFVRILVHHRRLHRR